MAADPHRHTPVAVVENYLSQGLDGVFGVEGSPPAQLRVDPHHQALAVQVTAGARAPDVVEFENLSFEVVVEGDEVWHKLSVTLDDNLEEVYAFLCTILDRVQLAGEPFAEAVEVALESLTGILAVRSALTREKQVGLFGELAVLLALADQFGGGTAMDCWRGPLGEEHDFGLLDTDIEVKTTLGERRQHWISSTNQLLPTTGRALSLLSIQLTAAAVEAGQTLPGLVSAARSRFDEVRLNAVLARISYRDRDADLYHSRWTLRTTPAFYSVDALFPAITQARLDSVVPAAQRITDLRYRLDLTGLPLAEPLFTIDQETWSPLT